VSAAGAGMDTGAQASEHEGMRHDGEVASPPPWEPLQRPAARAVWEEQLHPLAVWMAARVEALGDSIAAKVELELAFEEEVAWIRDGDGAAMLRASLTAGLRTFAEQLEHWQDPTAMDLPAATAALVREGARRGVPMAPLMRIYRLAVAGIWQELSQRLIEQTSDRQELGAAIELCSAWMFAYVDRAQTRAETLFAGEREMWLRSSAAAQAETIEAILAGGLVDALVAGQRLRYTLERHHVGVLAWLDPDVEDRPLERLDAALAGLQRDAGADGALVRPLGLHAASAWLSRATPYDGAALDALRVDRDGAAGVHIALGEPGAGLDGFRRTHAQTLHARRVAQTAGRPAGVVTRYGRVALCALATADPDHARDFVQRELGELAGADDACRRVAATLRVYLEEHTSRSRTARRLGIHENTVSYRIRRAEEILKRSVAERTLDLQVALALAAVLKDDRTPMG
jgi:DNA-binding PucR family transcriptional regulator